MLLVVVVVLCALAANHLSNWLIGQLAVEVTPSNEHVVHRIIMATAVVYAVLIAIPFVPGVEIGVSLMLMLGADLAFLVYVFTVLGLVLGFCIGRMIPEAKLRRLLGVLALHRASGLIASLEPLNSEQRLAFLLSRAPSRILPFLLRHRYIAVAVALNTPGNAVIGGGGGISLLAGMSRIFSFGGFLVMLIVAVSPVPLLVMFFGTDIFSD